MNSLEIINKKIKNIEECIKRYKRMIENFLLQDDMEKDSAIMSFESNIEYYNEKLQILYQIKTELEMWEICKKHLILDKEFHQIDLHLHHNTKYKEDYLKLKKELEITRGGR